MTAPAFIPRFPWWGGDLQTLRNRFVYRPAPMEGIATPLRFPLRDGSGDVMTATLNAPENPTGPLVVFVHGLTGSENSAYMVEGARAQVRRGRRALRLNLRGAGSSAQTCKGFYSAACFPDILDVVDQLDPALTRQGIFFVGASLGGSVTLNLLANLPGSVPCVGAATICAPIDPMEAALRLAEPRNTVYQRVMLRDMREGYLALSDVIGPQLRARAVAARTILEIDDTVTAPFHGYRDAQDYYGKTAGLRAIPDIAVPLLMVHAANDPWIPVRPYRTLVPPPNVTVEIPRSGGHVGFHGRGLSEPWHDIRIAAFLDTLSRERG